MGGTTTPLQVAVWKGSLGMMQILLDRGAMVDAISKIKKRTPLQMAVLIGRDDMVQFLLDRGAAATIAGVNK